MSNLDTPVESSGTPLSFPTRLRLSIGTFLGQMAKTPASLAGLIIVMLFLTLAIFGPTIAVNEYDDFVGDRNAAPSADFIFGTDRLGRDMYARILWGARETVGLPAVATALSVFLGTCIGLATGYFGGWFDELISRSVDILLAIPVLVLALVMLTTIVPLLSDAQSPLIDTIGPEKISLVIVIIVIYTPIVTRVIRSATLTVRDKGYVEAAKLRGESLYYILFREILPGVLPTLAVEGALRFSYAIFLVASLGFLGLGVQPPSPEWGRLVLEGRDNFARAPWTLWFPVIVIAILIIGVNLLADGLRRILRYEST